MNNRTVLDAATEITVAAITAEKISPIVPKQNFQKNVTDFFDAVYKQIEENVEN